MRRRRLVSTALSAAAAAVLVGLPAASASAATYPLKVAWQMDEARGATVMRDTAARGLGLHGTIGTGVYDHSVLATGITGTGTGDTLNDPLGGTGYAWRTPIPTTKDARRIITVPDHVALDPGTGSMAVEARMFTGARQPNIIQKGQSAKAPDGTWRPMWKVELHDGRITCMFRGPTAQRAISTKAELPLNTWHTVRCELRRGTAPGTDTVAMVVVGRPDLSNALAGPSLGSIDSAKPLTIGGKIDCNPPAVGCDYYTGMLNWVKVENQRG